MEEFDLETPLPINLNESEAETTIIMSSLLDMESDHMPCTSSSSSSSSYPQNYINIRGQIMSFLISNSSPHEKCNDRFLSYLAVNYLDRFLSTQPPILVYIHTYICVYRFFMICFDLKKPFFFLVKYIYFFLYFPSLGREAMDLETGCIFLSFFSNEDEGNDGFCFWS